MPESLDKGCSDFVTVSVTAGRTGGSSTEEAATDQPRRAAGASASHLPLSFPIHIGRGRHDIELLKD